MYKTYEEILKHYPSITDSAPTETLSELLLDTAETDKNSISSAIIFVENLSQFKIDHLVSK